MVPTGMALSFFVFVFVFVFGFGFGFSFLTFSLLLAEQWWCIPFVPVLQRQRQADLCEFEASLAYRAGSSIARATHRNPHSKNKNKEASEQANKQNSEPFPLVPCITQFGV